MRSVQFRLLTKLLDFAVIPDYIYAFEKNKSIPEMAAKHVEKKLVISIDLKDFFHSITQKNVFDTMVKMGIGEPAARTISEIATFTYFVPQGALTSPKMANIITSHTFGPMIKEYCDSKNLDLTIYADDVTISTNDDDISPAEVIQEVSNFIRAVGFRVNRDKTKIMRSSRRQYVCGVVVNKKTNLMKKERNRLRAIVHNIVTNGVEAEAAKNGIDSASFLNHIKGKVNWFRQLNSDKGQALFDKLAEHENMVKAESEIQKEAEDSSKVNAQLTTLDQALSDALRSRLAAPSVSGVVTITADGISIPMTVQPPIGSVEVPW